jgi:hypothetical protein
MSSSNTIVLICNSKNVPDTFIFSQSQATARNKIIPIEFLLVVIMCWFKSWVVQGGDVMILAQAILLGLLEARVGGTQYMLLLSQPLSWANHPIYTFPLFA